MVKKAFLCASRLQARLDEMMQALQPDELIISAPIYDLDKRKRSMEIVMEVAG